MSILSALSENRHDKKNLAELAKLPQALIMQMGQRKELSQEEVAMVISKKAEAIESAARQKALEQGGGQMPSVIEQDMMKIAQAENPAPPQQMMPQQMAQAQQLPEDVGIAQNPVPPMQLAGGGIIAFDEGGDIDIDPEDDYQDMIDQAEEDSMDEEIYGIINQMSESGGSRGSRGGRGESAAVGIRSGENKNIPQDTRERSGDMIDRLRAQILQKESGGRRYDKNGNLLTSSKGALGEMQVMPATARDPGFGIKPARSNDPDELKRVGDEYANVLLNRYRDPKLAMIAYNMGPGATDRWLAAGADISKLPKETQGYIRGVNLAEGGEVKHFVLGDLVMDDYGNPRGSDPRSPAAYDEYNRTPTELDDEIKRSKKAGRPLSKEAQKYLDNKAARAAGPKTPTPSAATTPYERYIKPALGRPSVAGIAVPAGIIAGGTQLGVSSMDTMADNPYFEGYSDPFMGDMAVGNAILNATKDKRREADAKKDNFVDPNIERLKKMNTYGNQIPVRAPEEKAPVVAVTPQQKAEEETFNLMQYIKEQQAARKKAAENDYNLAGLAAGLGILGGESPYFGVNVGKGGQAGVQQLGQLQKLRASQDIADNKLFGTAANIQQRDKYNRLALAQGKELKEDKLAQDLIINKNAYIQKRMKDYNMDEMMLGNLRRQQAKGKLDPDKLADLQFYEQQIRNIEKEANRMFPSPGTSSNYRLIGVR
jgi:hypothetical protein